MAIQEKIQGLSEQKIPGLGKAATGLATNIAKNKMKKAANNGMPKNATEQTWGGYNYNLNGATGEQGQQNALNGTGHVAGFPQGPQLNLIEPTQAPEPDAAVTPVTNTPTIKTNIQPAPELETNPNAVYDEDGTYLGSSDIVNAPEQQQEQEPEVVEEIPEQPFGAQVSQGGYIYGREIGTDSNGNDFQFGEYTNADPNSPEAKSMISRRNNYNALQAMDSYSAAALIISGTTPYGDQAMFDLQTYNPEKYKQIQDYVKELRAEDNIYALSHGSAPDGTGFVGSTERSITNSTESWVNQNSNERTNSQVSTMLSTKMDNNQTALTAKQQMMMYKDEIIDLQYEMDDLPNQAKKIFKGDMPEYLYKARISNRQQEIQSKMDKLESKFNAMSDIYKTELSHEERATEMELKYRQEERQQNYQNFEMWYKTAQLEQNSVQRAKDSYGNMKAYKIVNGQVIEVDDGTAYQGYTTTVSGLIDQANQMASVNAVGGQCEEFTDNLAQKSAGVRMVGLTDGAAATTAAEKAWYATQFGTFSDYIPEVGDVAVFTNNGSNGVSEKRGHTMYVTGYDPATGIISMVGSNNGGDERVYSAQYSLQDFYNSGGQGFWNPYKYAQYAAAMQSGSSNSAYSPMQPLYDELIERYAAAGKSNMLEGVGRVQEAYTTVYQDIVNGDLQSLVDEGEIGKFLNDVALFYVSKDLGSTTGGRGKTSVESALSSFLKVSSEEAISAAERYFAQNGGNEKAYNGFLDLMRLVEIKLRDESGAAINQGERGTDFMLYMPQAGDTTYTINRKLNRMEEYIRRLNTACGISSKQYIPLFEKNKKRSID